MTMFTCHTHTADSLGEEIAEKARYTIQYESWARRVLAYAALNGNDTGVRKAASVTAYAINMESKGVDIIEPGSRTCSPAIYLIPSLQTLEPSELVQARREKSIDKVVDALKTELQVAEDTNLVSLLDFAVVDIAHIVRARSLITPRELFDAIQMVEKTGSPATYISMTRADFQSMVLEAHGTPGLINETNKEYIMRGQLASYIGVPIIVAPQGVKDCLRVGTAYVTALPAVVGHLNVQRDMEVSIFQVEDGLTGWMYDTTERMVITNPYGVAKVTVKRSSKNL